jgi:hypothetical protein
MDPLGYGACRPPEREFIIEPFHEWMHWMDMPSIMQALSFKKLSIFGWCKGGVTVSATILAALHPPKVSHLGLNNICSEG